MRYIHRQIESVIKPLLDSFSSLLFFSSLKDKAIIDEIQNAPELLSYAKMIIDENREKKGLYVFTGSQQFHMIKNLGDSLAGRIALLDLMPFSMAEIKTFNDLGTTEEYFVRILCSFLPYRIVPGIGHK